MMYLCDIHSHSVISPDCDVPLRDMVRAAVAAGLHEFCVTDHCDLLDLEGNPWSTFDWSATREQYHAVKEALGDKLILRLGIELGSAPYDPETARSIIGQGGEELDFVLGSLHNWIGLEENRDFYCSSYRGSLSLARQAVENALDCTWTLVTKCSDCYDSLAHIVYPLRYIHRDGVELSLSEYEDRVRAIFTEVARTDHALEVNVCRGTELDCWPPLLDWFRQCGGQLVTVGADAHRPEDVAKGIPQALELVKAAGFEHIATFERREPVLHRL